MFDEVSDDFDKREGSIIFDSLSPTTIELVSLYIELDRILTEAYGDTASREYLVKRCAERGITPYEATQAVLQGVFTPDDIDVTGQRFNLSELNYVVTEKISDGVYKVQCETAGEVGNQYLGDLVPIDYIEGLETAELTAVLIPGEDEEDVEVLRERYFDSFNEHPFGGNVQDYLEKVGSIAGVGNCRVDRVWNGNISPSDLVPNAAVQGWYEGIIESLPDAVKAWLASVYTAALNQLLTTGGIVRVTIIDSSFNAASSTLIQSVRDALDPVSGEGLGLAPIGHVVHIESVTEITINVRCTITFESGYSWSNLSNTIRSAISDYLLSLRKQWGNFSTITVRIGQIESLLLNISGISDVTAIYINGENKNYVMGKYEIPVLGGVSG